MLSIGEFSKICGVSTKTLRHYGKLGLIEPDAINIETGYRSYSIDQLKKMVYIMRLKSYEFSLNEIKVIMNQSDEYLRAQLLERESILKNRYKHYKYLVKQVSNDIQTLSEGKTIMSYLDAIDVKLVELAPMNVISIRTILSEEDFFKGYDVYFQKLFSMIQENGLTITGKPMTIYHGERDDTEFCIPVLEVTEHTRKMNAGLCAKSVSSGPYASLTAVYARLKAYLEEEKYLLNASPFEIYMTNHHEVESEDLCTEVYFPVKKV